MQVTGIKGSHLSQVQERIWTLGGEEHVYRAQCALFFDGKLEAKAFLHSLQQVVDQHEILRTTFYCLSGVDTPIQAIRQGVQVSCPVVCMEGLRPELQHALMEQYFAQMQHMPFDLAQGLQLQTILFRTSLVKHQLLLSLPALSADAATLSSFVLAWSQQYQAYVNGQPSLQEEPLQYVDIAAWQDELLTEEPMIEQQESWRKIDQVVHQRLPFEQGHQQQVISSAPQAIFEPSTYTFAVDDTVSAKLFAFARRYEVSLPSVLLACSAMLLQRLLNQEELVLGVAGDGRLYEELAHALGPFTRYVPVSLRYEPQCSLTQFVQATDLSLQNALKHQLYFTWDDTRVEQERAGYFPFVFEHEYWPDSLLSTPELSLHLFRSYSCTEPFSLKLHFLQTGMRLQLNLHYDTRRIAAEQVQRMAAMLDTVLHEAVEQPQVALSALQILAPAEKKYLLDTFRGVDQAYDGKLLHQIFEDQVRRFPDKLAVINQQGQLTYQELNRHANQLACLLRSRGVKPNTLVGLCLPRSVQMLIGMLAIFKAGGAYVPLDPESPTLRLEFQLRDTQAPLLLTQSDLLPRFPVWDGQIVCLDALQTEIANAAGDDVSTVCMPQDLAYVMYTSGSTGVPKGVMIQQKSVTNYTLALCELLNCEPGWHYATVSTLAADLGNTAIFCSLASGGCLHILDYETIVSKEAFTRWTTFQPIDVLKIVPSHLIALLADNDAAHALLPVRALILGGEVLPPGLLDQLGHLKADCNIYNHYGPTETTIGVLVNPLGRLERAKEDFIAAPEHTSVSLGRAIANTDVYILDDGYQVVPIGVIGELYAGGPGVAMGYWQLPEQTATRFLPHPFSRQEGARLYRTGDLARYTPEGQVEFVGRRDSQVKIRGYRVELREIDALLREHPNVWDSVAMLREDMVGGPCIVGYIVPQQSPSPTSSELRDFVRERLPEYMVPASFVSLKVFPLTPNGKVDWRKLPKPEPGQDERDALALVPRSPIEEIVLDIWRELLAAPLLGVHDHFFQVGGHSLLATQVIARVRAILQVDLPITLLFEYPTIAVLARKIEQLLQGAHPVSAPPLIAREQIQDVPLSFAQQRLWFLDQLEPGSTTYLIQNLSVLSHVDVQAWERSLQEIVKRHESLRTVFRLKAGQPLQVICPATKISLPLIDLSGLQHEGRLRAIEGLIKREAQTPFDLAHGPLFRVALLHLTDQEYLALSTMHHIISDAWSNQVLERELSILYRDFSSHHSSSLPPLTIQYADFAIWQRQWLQGEMLERQLSYWKQQLQGISPLELPLDHPRPLIKTYHGSFLSLPMPAQLLEDLRALSLREGMTVFMVLLGAFHALLARYTSQTDISVGTPIANRSHQELESLIGFFVNTLVLRADLSGNPTFVEILRRIRAVALQAYAHQDVPFEQLVEMLQPERDVSRSPLFQVMFTMQQMATSESTEGLTPQKQLNMDGLHIEHRTTKFDLTLSVITHARGWDCGVEYNTDLFDAGTMQRLLEHWRILLQHIVADPQAALSDLSLLSESEKHSLLVEWNPLSAEVMAVQCIHTLFATRAASAPDAIALQFEDECLTYNQLNTRANQLAYRLQRYGVGDEVIVGVALERSLFLCISLLAILKAGGAYVPLDPTYPRERLAFMLADTGAPIVITRYDLVKQLPVPEEHFICIDAEWDDIIYEKSDNPITTASGASLAYVIYTSGSTGTPKGVMVNHANVQRLFTATQSWFHFDERDTWTLFHSYAFDFSVWELWGALLYGGKLIVVPFDISRAPETFYSLVSTQNVTVLNQTPSAFFQFMHAEEAVVVAHPLALRWVIFGGEVLDVVELLPWFRRHGEQEPQLVNMYGITEVTVHVTYRPLCMQDACKAVGSVIGRPIPDLQVYVLDSYLRPVPIGVPGQMYVGGKGLSRGYLRRAELTGARFIAHPFNAQAGERLYQTGDLARFLPNGELEYLGRIDDQVKIRGFRIELGEIETLLEQHAAVRTCVVIAREDASGTRRLVAYIVPDQKAPPSSSELRRFLLEKIPDYMMPAIFLFLEVLPLTFNGKLDRKALPVPSQERPEVDELFVLPRTATEEILAGIWASVLGRKEQVGIYDSFFALGGDSIKSIQVLSQARERGVHFSLQQLFQYQTIHALAQVVLSEEWSTFVTERVQPFSLVASQDRLLLPSGVEDAYPLAMLQAGMLFHSQYNPDTAIYHDINSFLLRAPFQYKLMLAALQQLTSRQAILRTSFDLSTFSESLQLVHVGVDIPLVVGDLQGLTPSEQEKVLLSWFKEEKAHPFEMTRAPLARFTMHLLNDQSFLFSLSCHHAILDGWSIATFFTELFKIYRAFLAHEKPAFKSALSIQFRDFVALEQRLLASPDAQHYWQKKLRDSTTILLPRWSSARKSANVPSAFDLSVVISQEVARGLQKLAHAIAVPIKSVLLAAHLRVLSLLSGQSDVVTGLVSNGRPEMADGDHVLGLFLNTLPFRLQLPGGTWSELVQQVFKNECEVLPYRCYPLAEIQRQQGGHPLFEAIFNFVHFYLYRDVLTVDSSSDAPQVTGRYSFEETNFTFAAYFSLDPVSSEIRLSLRCNAAELSTEQMEAIGGYYANALSCLANDPHSPYELQPLLSQNELELLLLNRNATDTFYHREQCLHEMIEEQVEHTPDRIAIVFEDAALTYAALNCKANQLAHHLSQSGIGCEEVVGIFMERSLEMIVGLLGVLKSGAAYLPLDPAYPAERLLFMIKDSQISTLVTQSELLDDLPSSLANIICLPLNEAVPPSSLQSTHNLHVSMASEQLAYVIYTSGSTGQPKGTFISHRAAVNFFHSMSREPGMAAQDTVLAVTSLSFDIAVLELLLPITLGACVHIANRETAASGTALAAQIPLRGVTILQATPTTWRMLLDEGWVGDRQLKMLCGGEGLPLELATDLLKKGASLWNMYGPTETTIWSTTGEVNETDNPISIGRAIDNTQILLLDTHFLPVPCGVIGELYIGGDGLARGYLHHADLTAEKFLPNPFGSGTRIYRTGDLARWLPDGRIECLGRVDRQIKMRGFRIEVGEIEAVLEHNALVKACAVILREDEPGNKQLVAYVVVKEHTTASELRQYLQERLPAYMVPSHFVTLGAFPQTPNGKVDRRALPAPGGQEVAGTNVLVAPRTPLEEIVLEIWRAVLRLRADQPVSVDDDFFESGGHSLLATQLIARIRVLLRIELPLRALFEAPTIAAFAQRIEQEQRGGRQKLSAPPLEPMERGGQLVPLSFAQQRLWFLYQLEPESTAYLLSQAQLLLSPLDLAALRRAFQALVARHESLRTTFSIQESQPWQCIHPIASFHLPLIDLSALSSAHHLAVARSLAEQEAQVPCNLEQGPLLRVWLLRVAAQEHILLLTMHHIITDAWSNEVFVRELTSLYESEIRGGAASPLAPLPIQYADFALWQRQWLQGEVLESQLAYWRRQLAGVPHLDLPLDHPRPPIQTMRGASLSLQLSSDLQRRLRSLSQQQGVTLFMLLLAAFQVLLAHYSGQEDISVGTPIANRTHPELEGLIGFFVNTLVLRSDLSGNPRFVDLLQQVRETALEAYAHQDVPFEKLVEMLHPQRDLSRSPLFQVMLIVQTASTDVPNVLEGTPLSSLALEKTISKFDLTLAVTETAQGLDCSLEYSVDLFAASMIERLLGHWQHLLEGIVQMPQATLADLPVLTAREYEQIVGEWNATQVAYPEHLCLPHLFERQVARTPDAIAVMFEEEQVSYEELNRCANRIAHGLRLRGVGPDVLVGICMERSVAMVIGLIAILKAGGAYVPLDPTYPSERLVFMARDAQVAIVLTMQDMVEEWTERGIESLCLDADWEALRWESEQNPESQVRPENLVYVIYTSGSTGRPKGVMISHLGLVNYLRWCTDEYAVKERYGAPVHSPLGFDLTVTSLFSPLLSGRTVVMLAENPGIESLERALNNRDNFSLLKITPAHLKLLNHVLPAGKLAQTAGALIIGGEELLGNDLTFWRTHAPAVRLINEYGPTETVVGCCIYEVPLDASLPGGVPIGRPIANMGLYILDKRMRPVPIGVTGELYIAGDGLARGYLKQPELTAERFLPNLFSKIPGTRFYRTGDMARYRADGTIEFLGRIDHQVKLRGYRIELGEIEAVLRTCAGVRESVVVVREEASGLGNRRLLAFFVGMAGVKLEHSVLRRHLQQHLPEYMIPTALIELEQMPLTSSGKIDRRALAEWQVEQGGDQEEAHEQQSQVQELVTGTWKEVLGKEVIRMDEDFFAAGGHSLLATQVITRIRALLEVELPLRSLFETPTVRGLALRVEELLREKQGLQLPPLVPAYREQDVPLSFAQQRLWFQEQLYPGTHMYLFTRVQKLQGTLAVNILERSLEELVRRHGSLRTVFQNCEGEPVQIVSALPHLALPVIDLSGLAWDERMSLVQHLSAQEKLRPYDLQTGPLLWTTLLRLGEEEHILLVTMHHIITDGWSLRIFEREIALLYRSFMRGQSSPLPAPLIQYTDFALWQRQWLQGEVLDNYLAYWRKQLADITPLLLPTDRVRPAIQSYHGAMHAFAIPSDLTQALVDLSRQEGVTLFMTMLAAFQSLLYRYCKQDDIVVGTDVANRNCVEVEGLIGFFINQLVLRVHLDGNPTFVDTLKQVRLMALEAYAHQDLPFDKLVEILRPKRSLQYAPLFQIKIIWNDVWSEKPSQEENADQPDLRVMSLGQPPTTVQFDLILNLSRTSQTLSGSLIYKTDLFDASTIERMADYFQQLLRGICANPHTRLDALEHLSQQEKIRQSLQLKEQAEATFADFAQFKPQSIRFTQDGEQL